ncbi:MAG: hypothetical protein NUV92_05360 [Ignavibacteria bacterium]|jgi:hypothetical protein|nr:hypothetical protein [Ignavibacteria bacterium]MDH7526931.1 hypothetical protein [Ignavibacteria bacterium]
MVKKIVILLFLVFVLLIGCDHGIAPRVEPPRTGFSGKIIFKNNWPSDIYQTRVVAFRETIKTVADFNLLNIGFISDTIPYGVSEFTYESDKNPLIEPQIGSLLKYIVVAQAIVPNPLPRREDWRVAGIYFDPNDSTKYGSVKIEEGIFKRNINIIVDFNNPPVQPPQ